MSLTHYLFSFSGRINRAKQWAIILVGLGFEVIAVTLFSLTVGFLTIFNAIERHQTFGQMFARPQVHTFLLLGCALYLLLVYISLAVTTKRLHDRDKSAWWILVFYVLPFVLNIPRLSELAFAFNHLDEMMRAARAHEVFVMTRSPISIIGNGLATLISLWAFVELFVLRGTTGDNRYGADPLAGRR